MTCSTFAPRSIAAALALLLSAPANAQETATAPPVTAPSASALDSLRAIPEPVWAPAFWFDSLAAAPRAAHGERAMVATANGYATRAAADVLRRGGTVVDAAVAAQFVLNVVEPQSSGIGGGCFILFLEAGAPRPIVIDGRETAPAAVTEALFLDPSSGRAIPYYPDRITGGLPVGVPGTVAAFATLHERAGRVPWRDCLAPAIELARDGFPVSPRLHASIVAEAARLAPFAASRQVFFDDEGGPLAVGAWLEQPDLARTLELIAADPTALYSGDIAEDVVDAVQEAARQPGLLTLADLKAYRAVERAPVHGRYRGYDVYGMGPPSSGGITLIETLNILEGFDLPALGPHSADALHLILEAEKLAFADRNRYIGDADHVVVPTETLVSDAFAEKRRRGIRSDTARQGPVRAAEIVSNESSETTHLSIADADGNVLAITTTIEAPFGSGMVVPGRGFLLNNELTDFDAYPADGRGRPVPNRVGPGKRPRSSMAPTIVLRDGKPVLAAGSPGGSRIIGITTHVVLNVLDWNMDVQAAVNAPRALDRGGRASELEALFFDDAMLRTVTGAGGVVDDLRDRGHALAPPPKAYRAVGGVHAVAFLPDGSLAGAADPRREGLALGVD